MKSLLVYILLNIFLVLGNCQGYTTSPNEDENPARSSQTEESTTIRSTSDHERGVAILSDASHLYRICNTRPQRVLPTYGSQLKRISGRTTTTLLRYVKPFKSFHDGSFLFICLMHLLYLCVETHYPLAFCISLGTHYFIFIHSFKEIQNNGKY